MYVTSVKCSKCEQEYSPHNLLTVCKDCGGALLFQYHLDKVAEVISKETLRYRESTFWKFKELLPITSPKNIVSLGEPYTPLLKLPALFFETLTLGSFWFIGSLNSCWEKIVLEAFQKRVR